MRALRDVDHDTTGQGLRVSMVSTYPPSRCGIGRFTRSLVGALRRQAPGTTIDVTRIVSDDDVPVAAPDIGMEFDPACGVSRRAAARHLDRSDVVIIQHEFGIFGPDDGIGVLDLVERIHRPVISVLHTVLPSPNPRQREIIDYLADTGHIVVPSRTARSTLVATHRIERDQVTVIPHGSGWSAVGSRPAPHRRLITWGLLGPGKGIERALAAVASLRDLSPPVTYRIVGQTHPHVLRHHGQAYRRSLEAMVTRLGLEDTVEFIDRYLTDDELLPLVAASDVVIVPYDNSEQISSGVLSEAVSTGRPVVATRFPHARELLGDGAGLVVDHDSDAMAEAIRTLLEQPKTYEAAAEAARAMSFELSWGSVADRYFGLLDEQLEPQRVIA